MRALTASNGAGLFSLVLIKMRDGPGKKKKDGVIKQLNEFVGLLFAACEALKEKGVCVRGGDCISWLENLLFQCCQRSFLQSSYHSMSNCPSSRNNLDFFLLPECPETKGSPLV